MSLGPVEFIVLTTKPSHSLKDSSLYPLPCLSNISNSFAYSTHYHLRPVVWFHWATSQSEKPPLKWVWNIKVSPVPSIVLSFWFREPRLQSSVLPLDCSRRAVQANSTHPLHQALRCYENKPRSSLLFLILPYRMNKFLLPLLSPT